MTTLGRAISCAVIMLFLIPSSAASFDREYSKEAVYRSGFNEGYRDGFHRGEFDRRAHFRNDYHTREYDQGGKYYRGEFAHNGHFKKGYKDGYRRGYRDGYRHIELHGHPRAMYR